MVRVDLYLTITLWIVGSEEPAVDLVLGAEARHLSAKLVSLSEMNCMRKPEAAYDILPEEFNNLLPCHVREVLLPPTL